METINRHHHRRLGRGTAYAALAALTLGLGAQACSSNDAEPGFKAGTYAIGLFIDDDLVTCPRKFEPNRVRVQTAL